MASLYVMLGSALGGLARFWLTNALAAVPGPRLPWGTLAINAAGSFAIGWFGALTAGSGRWTVAPEIRTFVMVGLCGGFTTFSSFSLQTVELIQRDQYGWAMAYIAGSVTLCLLAAAAGLSLGR